MSDNERTNKPDHLEMVLQILMFEGETECAERLRRKWARDVEMLAALVRVMERGDQTNGMHDRLNQPK